jgi:hypothetical protein
LEITMTESAAAPNVPAEPYTVTDVGGHVPVLLDDFVGATTVSVKGDDREYRLRGAGRKAGRAVEFHEKEPASAAAETPVWKIIEEGDGNIVAQEAFELRAAITPPDEPTRPDSANASPDLPVPALVSGGPTNGHLTLLDQ